MSCTQSKRIYSKELFLVFTLALLIFTACPAPAQEEQGETIYEPGAALLEIFKTDSIDKVSDLVPVIRTLWKRELACVPPTEQLPYYDADSKNPWAVFGSGGWYRYYLIPERWSEIGWDAPYIARFSFYYEAKQSGKYGFNIWHGRNACRMTIGEFVVIDDPINESRRQSVTQGVCKLEKGFHRVEFWLQTHTRYEPYFAIKVLTPDAFDAVPITKGMLLMKSADSVKP